ncbi:MAG: hypothetical protein HY292_26925 [Planctomycetes bacterium]|nr:hypothetical protein [Planctomycetota bacterium]
MDLLTFLAITVIVASLIVIFRGGDEKGAQYLAIGTLVVGVIELIYAGGRLTRFVSRLSDAGLIVFCVGALLALILYVKLKEKSFAMVLVVAAALQILVELRVIESVRK